MTQPTNKQEALDQIDSLRAYIEDCDKPKRVRVYVKEDATMHVSSMDDMRGGVWDFSYVEDSGSLSLYSSRYPKSDGGLPYIFHREDCIIVEGELPPNDAKES